MSEEAKKITVKLKYIPEKEDEIDVEIGPRATVSELKTAFENKLKEKKGNEFISENPVGLLKLDGRDLQDESKTLQELDIENDSVIQNENRVLIRTLTGIKVGVICNKDTTLKEFLEKARKNLVSNGYTFIKLLYAGKLLERKHLNEKLFDLRVNSDNTIGCGSILYLLELKHTGIIGDYEKNRVFNLQKLDSLKKDFEESSNLQKLDSNEEELKKDFEESSKTKKNMASTSKLNINNQSKTSELKGENKEHLQNNWSLPRKIIGLIDLVFLAVAIATFILNAHILIPIVAAALFVIFAFLVFVWNSLSPKILPKSWLGINLDDDSYSYKKEKEKNKSDLKMEKNEENKDL